MSLDMTRDHRAALTFQDINISRMDGVRDGYRVDALSPGINLIYGPNGIGKSRTAAALQALIWPGSRSGRSEIFGNMQVSGEVWRVELDFAKVSYQRDGVLVSSPGFAVLSESHRDRYLLTLQDLLRVENRNFAHEIQKEAAGGYDLGRVRGEMKIPTASRSFRPSKPVRPLQEARNEIYDLRRHETELRHQERSLSELIAERESANGAASRLGELEAARAYRDACDQLEAATLRRAGFPDPIGQMRGDEHELLQALHDELAVEEQKRQRREYEISALQQQLSETSFADAMPSDALIPTLRKRLGDLRQQDMGVRQVRIEIEECGAHLELLKFRIGVSLTDAQMEGLDRTGLVELAQLTREWQWALTALQVQDDLHDWLGKAEPQDRERLRKGTDLLSRYLREAGAEKAESARWVFFALVGAAVLLVIEAALLGISISPVLLLLTVFAVPLVLIAFRAKTSESAVEAERVRREYAALGLEDPSSWATDDVTRIWESLQEAMAVAELEHARATRWSNLEAKRQEASDRLRDVESRREAFLSASGLTLKENGPESLELLAKALDEWRRASDAWTKATSRKSAMETGVASTLAAVREELQCYGDDLVATDATSVETAIELLATRIERANTVSNELRHTKRSLGQEILPRISTLRQQISGVFSVLGLVEGDELALRNLCDQIEACREAQRAVESASSLVGATRCQLRPGFGYEELLREEIERALEEARELAARRDDLQERISRINAEIGQAQQQTRLEAAIAKEAAALDELEEGRQRDYDAAAARRVFELVQNRNREVNRPPVFRTADELFIAFTNGTYRLGLDDGESEFTALETASGRVLSLDHLSSGTRVQLLLAVRLAFIEATEQGPQLPLILDETLGNTDDTRAMAIIDATIEIARRGRQVLYFTAQQDEIGKWSSTLDALEEPVSWDVFDLARIRGKARAEVKSTLAWDRSVFTSVEVPDGTDYRSLFLHLDVPSIDLWSGHSHGVDLWYLMPDVPTLVELGKRGIRTWGQYQTLLQHQGLKGVWSERLHACAEVRVRVIETVCRAWQYGRPKPITKDCLRECGLITERFWAEVVHCAETNGWVGEALIDALGRGEVKTFRRPTIDNLSEWFREHGYISDVEVLPDEMIRASAISAAYEAIEQGMIDIHEIDELLSSITGEALLVQ